MREIAFIINHTSDGTALTPFENLYKLKPSIRKLTNAKFGELIACYNPMSDNRMVTRVDLGIVLQHNVNGTIWIDR